MSLYVLAGILVLAQASMGQSTGQCPTIGQQCDSSCRNVVLCASVGVNPVPIVTCPDNKFCKNYDNGTISCTSDHCSSPDALHAFKCLQEGTFPSAYKCDTYFICDAVGGAPQRECTCAVGETYDIPTHSCKLLADSPCRDPVDCEGPGSKGEIDKDKSFCYACDENFNALVYRCNGRAWQPTGSTREATCGPYTGPTPTPPADTSSSTSTTTGAPDTSSSTSPTTSAPDSSSSTSTTTGAPDTSSSTSTTTGTPDASSSTSTTMGTPDTPSSTSPSAPTSSSTTAPVTCKKVNERIKDELDCHSYYLCDANLQPIHKTCATGYIYDAKKFLCQRGTC